MIYVCAALYLCAALAFLGGEPWEGAGILVLALTIAHVASRPRTR